MTMRIGLVACCGKKMDCPAPARDLYCSELFRRSRSYVERTCDRWAILSAKHGVVLPEQTIAPYDTTLANMLAAERTEWTAKVGAQLASVFPSSTFTVLAGKHYRAAVENFPHTAPMAGLGIGEQLAWLGKRIGVPRYLMAITNREIIKIRGERKPFWDFLDEEPAGWLSSLAYPPHASMPGGPRILDCGAWSYRGTDEPKLGKSLVTPAWALEQYLVRARPGDFVVAPDHMLIPGLGNLEARRLFNLASARGFLDLSTGTLLRPMAVIHGETISERVETSRCYADMGYTAFAIGGLAGQASRKQIAVESVRAVREAVPDAWLHILGLSSPWYASQWKMLGIDSFDGSSHFKQAFTGGVFFKANGASLEKYQAARPGEPITAPQCGCRACTRLCAENIDTRSYGSNEHNMGRAAHNLNQLMLAQAESMSQSRGMYADRESPGLFDGLDMTEEP